MILIFYSSIPGYLGHSDLRTHWSIHSKSQDRGFAIFFAPHMIYLVCIHIVSYCIRDNLCELHKDVYYKYVYGVCMYEEQ